ncbi:MAG TPA: diadenylate cyclase, partial [Bacillota bacterium]|nr:diadenylate cyclase [Bacillota bacterium]
MRDEMGRDDGLQSCLRMIAPGTSLREGLESVLKAKTGGLIVVGDSKEVMSLVDGGFHINSDFLPAYMYELAKMDGAIILSRDCKKILYA